MKRYLLTALNTSADNLQYKRVEAETIKLKDGNYMNYNINAKHVSCTGHTCTFEQLAKFEALQK